MVSGEPQFMTETHSMAEQDYLKQIYLLGQETGRVGTQGLAARLGVKPSSVTAMVKRLAEHPAGALVTYVPYQGVVLTDHGRAIALEMVRHHRLLELFLTEHLSMPWEQVHAEAELLEHVISENLEDLIAAKLGQPTRDPHGDPIPDRQGLFAQSDDMMLTNIGIGVHVCVARVPDADAALLRYLSTLGVVPGARILVRDVAPYGGVHTIDVDGAAVVIGEQLARHIWVTPVRHEEGRT